jgi:hypothetical protein
MLHLTAMMNIAIGNTFHPGDFEDAVHALDKHGQPLQSVGNFSGNRPAVDTAALLEVSKLGNLHSIQPDFPAQSPGAQCGRFPVILNKADIVLIGVDADSPQAVQVDIKHIVRRRL